MTVARRRGIQAEPVDATTEEAARVLRGFVRADRLERLRPAMDVLRDDPPPLGFALEVERYPEGDAARLAVFDFHGDWLEWGA